MNDRLAAEIFQIVTEGLSNVRRHTHSAQARVALMCQGDQLTVQIANPATAGERPAPFVPRSIAGRAGALGGQVRVEPGPDGGAVVAVTIPL